MLIRRSAFALSVAILAVAVGCGSDEKKNPSVSFDAPRQAASLDGTFTASVQLDDFEIAADQVGKDRKEGEGHLHFSLDGGKFDRAKYSGANGKLAEQLGVAGKYSPSTTPSITYKDISPGEHTLRVELANNDHSSTGKSATTTFNVKAGTGASRVEFVDPQEGAEVDSTFSARASLQGFKINAAAVGKSKKAGEGHLHFSLDGGKFDRPKYSGPNGKLAKQLGVDGKYSPSVEPTITYRGIPSGEHTLEVYLANNDHSNTGQEAKVSFTVK